MVLEEGVGVSLINAVPEELIYATLRGIKVSITSCILPSLMYRDVESKSKVVGPS